eukprot:TRINITY_DN5165_c0_g1_i8.p1 TRINITY_DN5165_c0_g1~~TRINITY_DN5165_c0_g1_i8.p1  ORF type:complete len:337 (-),score=31.12 TRINITY_DN5165_c0_g1_i8:236-1246(-)
MSSLINSSVNIEKDTRTRLNEALQRYNYKQVDVARETGIHHSTLSLWLQRKIEGKQVKIEETIEQWLQNLYANKPRFSKANAQQHNKMSIEYKSDAVRDSDLIPIRLDIEQEGIRFRENICWNVEESYLSPEQFAKILAEENNLPSSFEHEIAFAIKRAVQNHRVYVPTTPEMIRVIELDVRIDNVTLKDRFEWDINDPNNNPEDFAITLCSELGLSGEFAVQIAHSIREQIIRYQRALEKEGGRRGIEDLANLKKSTRTLLESSSHMTNMNLKHTIAPPITITEENYLRPITQIYADKTDNLTMWEPKIEILDVADIKKVEKLEDRKSRYVRRIR